MSGRELKLPDDHPAPELPLRLRGFDVNDETSLMAYARYFSNDLDQYAERRRQGLDHFNSHHSMRGTHRQMLQECGKSANKHKR